MKLIDGRIEGIDLEKKKRRSVLSIAIIIVLVTSVVAGITFAVVERAYFTGRNLLLPNTSFSTSDMISVCSAIITFIGTSILGAISLWQNQSIREETEKTAQRKAELEAEPVFVIDLLGIDQRLPSISGARSLGGEPKYTWDNFALKLSNSGGRSVFNVILCEEYIQDVIKPNESVELYVAYDDTIYNNSIIDGLISINPGKYPRSDIKYPQTLLVGYNDVYGNNKIQQLKLCKNVKRYFYAKQALDEKFD